MDDDYRLSQAEWALWRFSVLGRPAGTEPSATFRSRLRHLIRLDRSGSAPGKRKQLAPRGGLTTTRTEGKGIDAGYTAYDVFALGIALELFNFGFNQSDILLLLGHFKNHLQPEFIKVLANPPAFPSHLNQDGSWRTARPSKEQGPDRRVFLIIRRMELGSAYPSLPLSKKSSTASHFREPQICHGLSELGQALDAMDNQFRQALVLEIAQIAARVSEFLDQAPVAKRGRKPKTLPT